MAKFICPFCLNEYDKKEIKYVCPDCGGEAKPNIFGKINLKCKTANCHGSITQRKCPACDVVIPKGALEGKNLPLSIVGVSAAGKTNYITVMLHELGRSSNILHLTLAYLNKEAGMRQKENYSMLVDKAELPDATTQSESEIPQIWQIKNLSKKINNGFATHTFTIFDGAGENIEEIDPQSIHCRYIRASNAIILAVDPLVIPNVRRLGIVDTAVINNSLGTLEDSEKGKSKDAVDIVNGVASYIKNARNIPESKVLDIPVAVVLTKFDTILDHDSFPSNALIKRQSMMFHNNRFDWKEMEKIDEEIRNWLEEIDEGSFINALEANFKEFYFFGVSSLGSAPQGKRLSARLKPHRVLDPILWLFYREGFID